MKKFMVLAAATLVMGSVFAQDGGKDKKSAKEKECCKKEGKECCKKSDKKDAAKTATVAPSTTTAPKKS